MKAYRRFSTERQMVWAVAAFAVVAATLDSGALLEWAERLEVGPERTVALPVAVGLHGCVGWMGLERWRHQELVALARAGWSDDPEMVAEARARDAGSGEAGRAVTGAVGSAGAGARAAAQPVAVADRTEGTREQRREDGSGAAVERTVAERTVAERAAERTAMDRLEPMAGDPPLRSELPALPAAGAGGHRTVALVGDSMMAVGLSSTLLREAPRYRNLTLVRAFKSGTGLARPEVFNWQREYPAMLAGVHPDVALVAIGANDGQGFVEDGVTYAFGSAGWNAIYERRVEAFAQMLEAEGTTVVWVGLPPMKSAAYNARIAAINRIDYAVVSASPRAHWFSSAGLVGDEAGGFRDFGSVRGSTTRLRQPDGIHLSDDGATLLTAKLLPWLAEERAAAKAVAGAGAGSGAGAAAGAAVEAPAPPAEAKR